MVIVETAYDQIRSRFSYNQPVQRELGPLHSYEQTPNTQKRDSVTV